MDPVPFELRNFADKREKKIDSKMLRALIFLPLFFHLGEAQSLNPVDQELVEASLQGDLETIKEIISNHKLTKDAEKNPKIRWEDAVTTPLHLAAGNGHLDIVKFYQEALEEDISSPNNKALANFLSPLANGTRTTPLICAIFNVQVNVVEFYLDYYEEEMPKLVKKLVDRIVKTKGMPKPPKEARKSINVLLTSFPYESFSATMLRDFKLIMDAIKVINSPDELMWSDYNKFKSTLTTPSLPFHLPDYIFKTLIERASNDTEFHWHLEVTKIGGGYIRNEIVPFFLSFREMDPWIFKGITWWFKNEILPENKVKVTEFEDGAQFDWTVGLPKSDKGMEFQEQPEQQYPNGVSPSPKFHIKLRIVIDNKPKLYFSKFISLRLPCFEILQSTIL